MHEIILKLIKLFMSCVLVITSISACDLVRLPQHEYYPTIVATDFAVGFNRIPFVLTDIEGNYLENQTILVSISSVDNPSHKESSFVEAEYHEIEASTPHLHLDGFVHEHKQTRGFYLLPSVAINYSGLWVAEFNVKSKANLSVTQNAVFEVRDTSIAIALGDDAPLSRNPALSEQILFADVSSRNVPSDKLHQLSVEQALMSRTPLIVVFASPRFCISALCGPAVDLIEEVQLEFEDRVNFIHIEPWDLSIARSEGRLIPSKWAKEWNLPSEPWVFLIGPEGRVAARFEGPVSKDELTKKIQEIL